MDFKQTIELVIENHFRSATRERLRGQIKIGIDLDSTIAKIDGPWLTRLNEACQTNYHPDHWTDWNLSFLKDHERKIFFEIFTPDLYQTVMPYEGAVEAVRDLASNPLIKLACVTTNPSRDSNDFVRAKISWLKKHFPALADSVLFAKNKSGLGLDVLVDDAPHNFENVDFIPVLVIRPWNNSVICPLRFTDWDSGKFLLSYLAEEFERISTRRS